MQWFMRGGNRNSRKELIMELSKNQKEAISRVKDTGVLFEFPTIDTVIVKQNEIIYSQIFSNKQLYSLAKEIFPESKIIPVVYSLDLDKITIEWVTKNMRLYGINAKDLQRQLGFEKETINDFLKLRTKLKPLEKSSLFYYFLTFENNKHYLEFLKLKKKK
jgi:hypothetical protein